MNQQDLDKAIKTLPSPDDVETDRYVVYSFSANCRFIFVKEIFFVTPQKVTLAMWRLKDIQK
jgi:hypothetical protein